MPPTTQPAGVRGLKRMLANPANQIATVNAQLRGPQAGQEPLTLSAGGNFVAGQPYTFSVTFPAAFTAVPQMDEPSYTAGVTSLLVGPLTRIIAITETGFTAQWQPLQAVASGVPTCNWAARPVPPGAA